MMKDQVDTFNGECKIMVIVKFDDIGLWIIQIEEHLGLELFSSDQRCSLGDKIKN